MNATQILFLTTILYLRLIPTLFLILGWGISLNVLQAGIYLFYSVVFIFSVVYVIIFSGYTQVPLLKSN